MVGIFRHVTHRVPRRYVVPTFAPPVFPPGHHERVHNAVTKSVLVRLPHRLRHIKPLTYRGVRQPGAPGLTVVRHILNRQRIIMRERIARERIEPVHTAPLPAVGGTPVRARSIVHLLPVTAAARPPFPATVTTGVRQPGVMPPRPTSTRPPTPRARDQRPPFPATVTTGVRQPGILPPRPVSTRPPPPRARDQRPPTALGTIIAAPPGISGVPIRPVPTLTTPPPVAPPRPTFPVTVTAGVRQPGVLPPRNVPTLAPVARGLLRPPGRPVFTKGLPAPPGFVTVIPVTAPTRPPLPVARFTPKAPVVRSVVAPPPGPMPIVRRPTRPIPPLHKLNLRILRPAPRPAVPGPGLGGLLLPLPGSGNSILLPLRGSGSSVLLPLQGGKTALDQNRNFTIVRGTDVRQPLNPIVLDQGRTLTGAETWEAQIKEKKSDAAALLTLNTASGIVLDGNFEPILVFIPADTPLANFPATEVPKRYWWGCEMTKGGKLEATHEGYIIVITDVAQ